MRRSIMRELVLAAVAAATMATGAAPAMAKDWTGTAALRAGDYTTAARELERAHRAHGDDPVLTLNLAMAYRKTGHNDAASVLYREVLAQPDIDLTPDAGPSVSAHRLAEDGLERTADLALR
jgi:Tfp pilus assembly protein PilF